MDNPHGGGMIATLWDMPVNRPIPNRAGSGNQRSPGPDPDNPFLRSTAIAAGWSDDVLAGTAYTRLFHGVHICSDIVITLEVRCRAALVAAPAGSVVAGPTAAQLWRGIVPDAAGIHVLVPTNSRFTRAGIVVTRGAVGADLRLIRGVAVTSPERTFADLAKTLGLVDLVVFGDSLLRLRVTSSEALMARSASLKGRPRQIARRAAELVRTKVDSPPESRLRMLLVLAGLPEPTINHELCDADGRVVRRIDLAYVAQKIAIEYDGRHHEVSDQRSQDLLRREDLEAAGWKFVVVVADHTFRDPASVLARVTAAMRQRGMTVPKLDQRWRDHIATRT